MTQATTDPEPHHYLNPYPNLPPSVVNPNHEPYGHYTGRCPRCQSADLWDDNMSYGCNNCGAFYGPDATFGPVLVPNRRG